MKRKLGTVYAAPVIPPMTRRQWAVLTAKWWLWRLRIIPCEGCGERWQRDEYGDLDCPERIRTHQSTLPHGVVGYRG